MADPENPKKPKWFSKDPEVRGIANSNFGQEQAKKEKKEARKKQEARKIGKKLLSDKENRDKKK